MKVIGIDIGTTSICGVVLDAENGKVLKSKNVNSEAFIDTHNEWEKIQDVAKIVAIASEILDSLLKGSEDEILAIGLTGQMHGIVYVDAEGQAVSPLYTWQDARGNLPYKDTTYAGYLGSFSGYGNVTDFYNRENGLVPKSAVTYCTIHDYLGMLLCNNKKPILHTSDAASLGLYDVEKKKFDYNCTAHVTDSFAIIGTYEQIPVSIAIGDNQASVFSTLADNGNLLINIGTGSQISIVSNYPITAEGIECRPYVDGKYLIVGAALCGGRAYSLLKDFYRQLLDTANCFEIDVYSVMDKMLADKADTTLHVDTRFAGTRADPNIRGSVTNISVDNFTPPDLTVGVLNGMIEELYRLYRSMGENRNGIIGSGNGVRKNKALVRIAEQVFKAKLRVPLYTEEAACGAALFALIACGKYRATTDVQKLIQYEEG
ncbi:MAG: hypothetical protein J6B71_02800 [Clostridia bacterium]|nr:hypothetical protein [Clostridia bacterium]